MSGMKDKTDDTTDEECQEIAPSGRVLKYYRSSGLYFLSDAIHYYDPRPSLAMLPEMKGREDDVVVCGCLRSGTNWIWEITNMLLRQQPEYQRGRKTPTLIEFQKQEYFDEMKSPRILSTHLRFQHIPDNMKDKQCKVIYIQRNPKDVTVSFYNYLKAEIDLDILWDDFVHMFVNSHEDSYTFWVGTTKSWEKAVEKNPNYPILLVYYEAMKQDPVKEIIRLADFLEVPFDEDLIAKIVQKTNFKDMRKAKLEYLGEGEKYIEQLETYDKRQQYYRKGEVGDWKNHFTVAQNEYFDKIMGRRMKDSNLKFTYEV